MTNPPYLENNRGKSSPHPDKNKANQETDVDLESWARFCLLMVKPKGTVTFIHRADRLDHIMAYFAGKLGNMTIYPLWPGKGKSAKRVIVSGTKNMNGPLRLSQGMVLHEADGRFTRDAEGVLRDGEKIEL
jgi:tRNA1(Val) A37 N6-methylase TrmN6